MPWWRWPAHALRRLPALAVLGIAWSWLIVYAHPGIMTQDSFDHLREARDNIYSDAHPPFINVIWKVCDYFVPGPFLMLLLQSGLFLGGLYLLMRRTFSARRAAWLASAVFLFPPVGLAMAVIWKDNLMTAMLVLGLVGLLSERRAPRLWGLAALVCATAFRYNALGATLPLVVLLFDAHIETPRTHSRLRRVVERYTVAAAAWLAVTLAGFGINKAITDKPMHYWQSSLALHDIVGTLAHVDGTLTDDELRTLLAGTRLLKDQDIHAEIRAVYSPAEFIPILTDDKHKLWEMPINGYEPAPKDQRDAVAAAFWHILSTYPAEYAHHRLAVMRELMGWSKYRGIGITNREFWSPDHVKTMGLPTGVSRFQKKLTNKMRWLVKHTPIFIPYMYLVITLLLLPLAFRHRDALAILLSGLSMQGTLLFLAHSVDYRYSHWMVLCTIVAAILLFTARYRARAPS